LKNVFYFHLRNKLSELLIDKNLRIFPEFHDGKLVGKGVKADIAIIKICENEEEHIGQNIVMGRLTELSACYYTGQEDMLYTVISYNDMNTDLNYHVNDKQLLKTKKDEV